MGTFSSLNNAGMVSKLLRVIVAAAAFAVGVLFGTVYRHVQQQPLAAEAEVTPAPAPEIFQTYPETWGLTPREIASFINDNPQANLDRLWQRLGVTDDSDTMVQFSFSHACASCEANIFEYNLDDDVDREALLQIKQGFGEMYRYLIFNDARDPNPKLLGKVDVWTKYRPSDPVVFVSNDRAWLILQNTAATGSGLAAWTDTVYEVSNSGVRRVGSYLSEVKQSGGFGFPAKAFAGRPVSCEIKNGHAILKVSYTVEYFGYQTHLFTKQKTVVLGSSLPDGSPFVLAGLSEITPHEFETIYNFDSMSEDDFLTYNHDELCAIATGNDNEKKTWLTEFLSATKEHINNPQKAQTFFCL